LKCRRSFYKYIVDIYAKIKSERLRYILFHQTNLRFEEYIHLRDAINNNIDCNSNLNEIEYICILSFSYSGNPRHTQEYILDTITYVRPDLSIKSTCNPRRDVVKEKFKFLINLIAKHHVFDETQCRIIFNSKFQHISHGCNLSNGNIVKKVNSCFLSMNIFKKCIRPIIHYSYNF